jgi:hypothetical protein
VCVVWRVFDGTGRQPVIFFFLLGLPDERDARGKKGKVLNNILLLGEWL